jgi:hypothetical protein
MQDQVFENALLIGQNYQREATVVCNEPLKRELRFINKLTNVVRMYVEGPGYISDAHMCVYLENGLWLWPHIKKATNYA